MTLRIELPLRIESVANGSHGHWRTKAGRTKRQREAVQLAIPKHKLPGLPCEVKLIRLAPRRLDGDNLQSGFKAVRDGVADRMGIKDNDPRVTWVYDQRRGEARQYGCVIEISPMPETRFSESACG